MEELARLLVQYNLKISTAESCTGGLVAGEITKISGISQYFEMGVVTYSNEAKQKLLGVSSETLSNYGAVSEQCAGEMCRGIQQKSEADIGISVTGIAGPTGGTADKPVGLVYIGAAYHGETIVQRHLFKGDRDSVRTQTVAAAIALAKDVIKKFPC